jgi:hypothetical protein
MAAGHRVAIVVGPGFAAHVRRIAGDRHVWAICTPEYQRAANEERRSSPRHALDRGVTLFGADNASPEDEVISILGAVEEHHGKHSHDPPLDEVEVLGAEPTPEVRAELSAFGFTDIVPAQRGFVALRRH